MLPSKTFPPSRSLSRNIDDASSSSTPDAALGNIGYLSSPLSDIPESEAYTDVRDTPPRGNRDVQAWVDNVRMPPDVRGHGGTVALESQCGDNAGDLVALPMSPEEIAIDENDIIIAVMGPTGAGKSTFVDCAVGRLDVGVGHDLISYTKEMRPVRYPHSDGIRNIVLVDTSGFNDTSMTDAQVLRQIAHWLNATYKKHMKLTGVLYLHRILDNRVSGTPLRNYNMFKELCGKENFKNVILVTTMWDKVTEEVGSVREKELHSDFWRPMINLGSSVHRFEGTMESAWKIINTISVATLVQRRPLVIQQETVDEHVPLHGIGRAVTATLTAFMSGVKGVFKHLTNGTKRSPGQILQDRKHLFGSSPSLSLTSSFTNSPDTPFGSGSGTTGMISHSSPGTCSAEGYWGALGQVILALRAALGVAELVRIPYLKDVISPSLSTALSIKTMTGTHHALFQVLATATLLINVIAEHAKQTKLSAEMKAAIEDFAKHMSDVQGITQAVTQRQPETRHVLQTTDARVISACANSMRLVCDVLRSTPSVKPGLSGVYDSFGALMRGLKIDSCGCGIPGELLQSISPGVGIISPSWFTENDYVIFVVGPAGAGKSWFCKKLFENRNIPVVKIRRHVQALRCNFIDKSTNIVIVRIPSFYTDHEDSAAENTVINWLKLSFSSRCHSGILFLHSLDSDSTHSSILMAQHLEAFAKALPNKFMVPSHVYVVPTSKPDSTLPSEESRQQLSQLSTAVGTLNSNRSHKWHASMFPGVFHGQPELAWNVALLLLKDVAETQAKELFTFPRPSLRHLPARLPDARLALKELSDLLLREFKKNKSGDLDALITLARTALKFTPPEHPYYYSALIGLANVLRERFEKEDRNIDLDELIVLRRAAWERMLPDNPERQTILLELDDCLYERFRRGDAMADLEEIIFLRRAALERTPPLNRCRQLLNLANSLVEKFDKLGLATDVKEAINLGRAALELCPTGHPDHALSQDCLANYLDAKIRKRGARARITGVGRNPSSPTSSDIKQFIRKIVFEVLETIPLRLLHTPTGILCNRDMQLSHFERSPQYQQLLSLMSTCDSQPSAAQIHETVKGFFRYATLSHRWASGEPLLRDVEGTSIYDVDGGDGLEKLQHFSTLALRRGFSWAWSDTCCIDKGSSAELQEAIGSMFSWYASSSLTLVHLSDISDIGSLADSVWFERGWTLQELLASHAVLFYTQDWSLYMNRDIANHKVDDALLKEVEKATGIEKQHLMNFYPGLDNAQSRLHWASRRRTTRPEDIAYSLFGIFKIHLPIIYGESAEIALGRLLAEIISRSGDVSVLDWVGQTSSFNSCFPASLVPYQMIPRIQPIPGDPARPNDLEPEQTRKLYSKLAGLPRAGFGNNKLTLPSIIYQVTAVILQGSSSSPSRYSYAIHASGLMPLEVTLSVNLDKGARRCILARPWNPKALPTQTSGDEDAVWELLEQLRQPFNALLLKKLPHNEYRRIASDCMITARPQDLNSILDSQVLIPEIV